MNSRTYWSYLRRKIRRLEARPLKIAKTWFMRWPRYCKIARVAPTERGISPSADQILQDGKQGYEPSSITFAFNRKNPEIDLSQ